MAKVFIKADVLGNVLYTISYASNKDADPDLVSVDFLPVFNPEEYYYDAANKELKYRGKRPESHYDWDGSSWISNITKLADNIRKTRNNLLAESDWTQLMDINPATRNAWTLYRQKLRDITDSSNFPNDVVWPIPPEEKRT